MGASAPLLSVPQPTERDDAAPAADALASFAAAGSDAAAAVVAGAGSLGVEGSDAVDASVSPHTAPPTSPASGREGGAGGDEEAVDADAVFASSVAALLARRQRQTAATAPAPAAADNLLLLQAVVSAQIGQAEADARVAALTASVSTLTAVVAQQATMLAAVQESVAALPAMVAAIPRHPLAAAAAAAAGRSLPALGAASTAAAAAQAGARTTSPLAPPTGADGTYRNYAALAAGDAPAPAAPSSSSTAAAIRSAFLALQPKERAAVGMLAELAPMDVDGDVENLGTFLPPSEGEVTFLLEDMSHQLRRALITQAELRSAWTASRRALMSVPAPVGVERTLLVAAAAADGVTDGVGDEDDESLWVATRPEDEVDEAAVGSRVITLGEGRVALEMAVANRNMAARIRALEAQVAGARVAGVASLVAASRGSRTLFGGDPSGADDGNMADGDGDDVMA